MALKRKICFIVPAHWEALMGGSQYQAKILIDHLLPLNKFEIYYLSRRINPNFTPEGYRIIKISDLHWYHRYGYFFDTFKLLRLLNKIRPDIIYQQVGCSYTGVAAYYAKRSGCKMIWRVTSDKSVKSENNWSLRELFPDRYIERKMLQYGIRNCSKILVQTETQAELLRKNLNIEGSELIRNFHPEPTEAIEKGESYSVLWVANFKRLKRPEMFIRLARDLLNIKNVRFIMIGAPDGGQWQQELDRQIKSLGNLTYLGAQSQHAVNQLLAESHMLINTSEYEGFSNTFIQAWMRKVPVVSLKVNPDNLLSDGRLGFCAEDDYLKLKDQVSYLLKNPEEINKIGDYAQGFSFEHYGEKNIRRLIDIMEYS